jgi:isocitrate/isopropylmalate dehydrogenase
MSCAKGSCMTSTIRKHFDLYANIRPAKAFEGGKAVVPGTDLVIVRENTEGFYADRNTFAGTGEFMPTPDVSVDDFHIDAMTVHLVRGADRFDVIVTENMFGDILSDLAGEIAGSLGIAPSVNSSDTHAMAQAAHGSAPDIAGKNAANPIAMILSSGMLLDWLGARHDDPRLAAATTRVERGVAAAVAGGISTRDLGGTASTTEFTAAVVDAIRSACAAALR